MSYLFVNVERFYERNFVWLVFGCDAFIWKLVYLSDGKIGSFEVEFWGKSFIVISSTFLKFPYGNGIINRLLLEWTFFLKFGSSNVRSVV